MGTALSKNGNGVKVIVSSPAACFAVSNKKRGEPLLSCLSSDEAPTGTKRHSCGYRVSINEQIDILDTGSTPVGSTKGLVAFPVLTNPKKW